MAVTAKVNRPMRKHNKGDLNATAKADAEHRSRPSSPVYDDGWDYYAKHEKRAKK